jgi:uncharacterized membrane protein
MVVLGGGLIALIVWGITRITRQDRVPVSSHALDLAKERYTRGVITRDEFEQIKKELRLSKRFIHSKKRGGSALSPYFI